MNGIDNKGLIVRENEGRIDVIYDAQKTLVNQVSIEILLIANLNPNDDPVIVEELHLGRIELEEVYVGGEDGDFANEDLISDRSFEKAFLDILLTDTRNEHKVPNPATSGNRVVEYLDALRRIGYVLNPKVAAIIRIDTRSKTIHTHWF